MFGGHFRFDRLSYEVVDDVPAPKSALTPAAAAKPAPMPLFLSYTRHRGCIVGGAGSNGLAGRPGLRAPCRKLQSSRRRGEHTVRIPPGPSRVPPMFPIPDSNPGSNPNPDPVRFGPTQQFIIRLHGGRRCLDVCLVLVLSRSQTVACRILTSQTVQRTPPVFFP